MTLHMNWNKNWANCKVKIVFTEEYVSRCLNLAIQEQPKKEDMSFDRKFISEKSHLIRIAVPIC